MAHMCVKLSPLSLEWPQSTGTKCMLSHDHVFVAPVLEFYLLGERESVLLSTHTTQAHPIGIVAGLACGHTARDFCETHGNGLGSARVPRSLPHIW